MVRAVRYATGRIHAQGDQGVVHKGFEEFVSNKDDHIKILVTAQAKQRPRTLGCWVIGHRIRMPCRTGLAPLAKKLELLLKRPDVSPPFATQCLTRVRERSSAVLVLWLTLLD